MNEPLTPSEWQLADRLGLAPDDGTGWINDLLEAEDRDAAEAARQARIAAGFEYACVVCGCSESRACPGGCVWAAPNLCSRCAYPGRMVPA